MAVRPSLILVTLLLTTGGTRVGAAPEDYLHALNGTRVAGLGCSTADHGSVEVQRSPWLIGWWSTECIGVLVTPTTVVFPARVLLCFSGLFDYRVKIRTRCGTIEYIRITAIHGQPGFGCLSFDDYLAVACLEHALACSSAMITKVCPDNMGYEYQLVSPNTNNGECQTTTVAIVESSACYNFWDWIFGSNNHYSCFQLLTSCINQVSGMAVFHQFPDGQGCLYAILTSFRLSCLGPHVGINFLNNLQWILGACPA